MFVGCLGDEFFSCINFFGVGGDCEVLGLELVGVFVEIVVRSECIVDFVGNF